jgi:hypothetical protein
MLKSKPLYDNATNLPLSCPAFFVVIKPRAPLFERKLLPGASAGMMNVFHGKL